MSPLFASEPITTYARTASPKMYDAEPEHHSDEWFNSLLKILYGPSLKR